MSIFEYDEEKHMRTVRSEGFEEGFEQGIGQGIERGLEQKSYQVICNMFREGLPEKVISRCTGYSMEHIKQIRNEMLVES